MSSISIEGSSSTHGRGKLASATTKISANPLCCCILAYFLFNNSLMAALQGNFLILNALFRHLVFHSLTDCRTVKDQRISFSLCCLIIKNSLARSARSLCQLFVYFSKLCKLAPPPPPLPISSFHLSSQWQVLTKVMTTTTLLCVLLFQALLKQAISASTGTQSITTFFPHNLLRTSAVRCIQPSWRSAVLMPALS